MQTSKMTNKRQTNDNQMTTTNNVTSINKIKLNYLYLYITEKAEKF